MIQIRDVRDGDLEQVREINQLCKPAVSDVTHEELQWFQATACYFRVAAQGDDVLGFLIGLNPSTDYDSVNFQWFLQRYDSFFYVDRVAIRAEARHRALGTRFYADIEEFARPWTKLVTLEVNIRPRNEVSLAFHAKHGFETVGTQDTEEATKTVQLMVKNLP